MRAADKVSFVNAMNGAYRYTFRAAGAQGIIDNRKVVLHLDRARGASLFAFLAADTAVCAIFAGKSALVVIRAFYNYSGCIVDQLDDVVGAGANADAAADAFGGNDFGNALLHHDCVVGALVGTVAVAEASENAALVTAIQKVCGGTALRSSVLVFAFDDIAGSVTGNVSDLLDDLLCFNPEDACDRTSGMVAAGSAKVGGFRLFLRESLCVAVASAKSASTAVRAGKAFADGLRGFILLDTEEYTRQGQQNGTKKTDCG